MAFETEFVPGDDDRRDLTFVPAHPESDRTLSREQVETCNRDSFRLAVAGVRAHRSTCSIPNP